MKENGVKHLRSAPYHPATNGIVEQMVQTFKKAMMKRKKEGRSEQHILSNFLIKYRSTPHSVTGVALCELMLKRPIRTVLDLLKPSVSNQVFCQAMQKSYHDKKSQNRTIAVGQLVMVRNYRKIGSKWVEGTIVKKSGEKNFLVKIADGQVWKRHLDQVFVKEGIDYDYDHPGIEHSSGISAEQTEPTTDSTITTDTDTVEDSSARHFPNEIIDLQKD